MISNDPSLVGDDMFPTMFFLLSFCVGLCLSILFILRGGTISYNRSQGNLHKIAYLALNKVKEINGDIEYSIEKKETKKSEIENTVDIGEKYENKPEYFEKEQNKQEEEDFPYWIIPIIIVVLYMLYQAIK